MNILDGNVNGVEFPDFIPTSTNIIVKVIGESCAYHSVTAGGLHLPTGQDQSAFVKCEIIELGPECSELLESAAFIHCLVAGGMRGLKPISMANGHFVVDEKDVFFWEPLAAEEKSAPIIQLVTE